MRKRAPTERDKQREETRRRVYEAALAVFRADGVPGARIDDIARAAGVSRGTFYFHFPTKDDVLLELLNESERLLTEKVDALADDAPIRDVLSCIARNMAAIWEDDPSMLPEVGTVAMRVTSRGLDAISEFHPIIDALTPRFRTALDRGETDALIPPELLAQFFLINLFGAALAWVGTPMLPLEDLLENVVDFFLRAASAPEG